MSHNGRGRFRPLGQIRANLKSGGTEKIPKLSSASSVTTKANLEIDNQGILGNAMSVPPPKEKEKKEEKVKVQSAKSDSGSSTKSLESEYKKELQDAKVSGYLTECQGHGLFHRVSRSGVMLWNVEVSGHVTGCQSQGYIIGGTGYMYQGQGL